MIVPVLKTFDAALSDHQRHAMTDEVKESDQGYVLDISHVHGNAVRGLARHGLLVVIDGKYARLTPLGVRLHAALNESSEEEALRKHALAFPSATAAVLAAAGAASLIRGGDL